MSTGEVIDAAWLRFSFPTRWHYDVLRGLEHFRSKRQPDGTWLLDHTHPGRIHFTMEEVGQPSRWNTLRAMRVLDWWEGASAINA